MISRTNTPNNRPMPQHEINKRLTRPKASASSSRKRSRSAIVRSATQRFDAFDPSGTATDGATTFAEASARPMFPPGAMGTTPRVAAVEISRLRTRGIGDHAVCETSVFECKLHAAGLFSDDNALDEVFATAWLSKATNDNSSQTRLCKNLHVAARTCRLGSDCRSRESGRCDHRRRAWQACLDASS